MVVLVVMILMSFVILGSSFYLRFLLSVALDVVHQRIHPLHTMHLLTEPYLRSTNPFLPHCHHPSTFATVAPSSPAGSDAREVGSWLIDIAEPNRYDYLQVCIRP